MFAGVVVVVVVYSTHILQGPIHNQHTYYPNMHVAGVHINNVNRAYMLLKIPPLVQMLEMTFQMVQS